MKNVHRCPNCSELKQKKLIIRHINLIHYTKKEKCDLCGLVVNTTEKPQAHMGKVYINKKNFDSFVKESSKIGKRQITSKSHVHTFQE